VHAALVEFYEGNGHRPAWFDGDEPSPRAAELVAALSRAERDGLAPGRYRADLLEEKLRAAEDGLRFRDAYPLDLLLSQAFVVYGNHLASGRVHPDSLGSSWFIDPRGVDLARALGAAVERGPEAVIDKLRPPHQGYDRLLGALERYREIAADGGWPKVPDGPVLSAGDPAPRARLEAIVRRLAAEGDVDPAKVKLGGGGGEGGKAAQAVYAEALAAAVHRFQDRHGITEDGKLGPETLAALNVSPAQRVRQIELNLERWRWLPGDLGKRRVEVNLPGYFLSLMEGDRAATRMRVVVGKAGAATPAFSDRMAYVVINPYWNVPESIVAEEIAPQVREDPSYLASNDYEVVEGSGEDAQPVSPGSVNWSAAGSGDFPYLVRQRPGEQNALGKIKFMFPNDHNIYLHDTPAKHLFKEVERTFSHGCIRVQRPLDLAQWAFEGDPEWDRARIERAIASGEHTTVSLPEEIPVYLLYWTAWVDDGGSTHFRKDIYSHDQRLVRALDRLQPRSRPRVAAGG
jgi:murein L,D-transpeptidase YcbB/YkuD